MKLEFTIRCNPPKATHQASLRIMKRADGTQFVGKFAKSKGKAAQNDLMTMLRPHAPQTSLKGPIACEITWVYPWRKSETKRNRAKCLMPCDTRPDCDNLCKMLFDAMTRLGFWDDDSQIFSVGFRKYWGDVPGIYVTISNEMERENHP